jgi:hypothetical protein
MSIIWAISEAEETPLIAVDLDTPRLSYLDHVTRHPLTLSTAEMPIHEPSLDEDGRPYIVDRLEDKWLRPENIN